jgi:hypothetical protein
MGWIRNRMLRWLANGGQDVTLGIQGAHFVTVDAAGVVTVNGGKVVAKNCQVVQDSTGKRILTEPEQLVRDVETAAVRPQPAGKEPKGSRAHATVINMTEPTAQPTPLAPAERIKHIIGQDRQAVQKNSAKDDYAVKAKPRKRAPAAMASTKAPGIAAKKRIAAPSTAGKNNGWAAHNSGNSDIGLE